MAIYDNNGSTNYEIGKLYDNNGSTSSQIGKVYDNNGTTNSLIYSAGVVLTNLVGSGSVNSNVGISDAGDQTKSSTAKALTVTNGHRYFCRANLTGFSYRYSDWSFAYHGYAKFNGQAIVDSGYKSSQFNNTDFGTNNVIITANSTTGDLITEVYSNGSSQSGTTGTFYMVVDITALEAEKGTLTAAQVWSLFGSAVWYGSREIEV